MAPGGPGPGGLTGGFGENRVRIRFANGSPDYYGAGMQIVPTRTTTTTLRPDRRSG